MKKVLIICAGGMSSSLLAQKTMDSLQEDGYDILVEATGTYSGQNKIKDSDYDIFFISPQTKMYFSKMEELGKKAGKPVVQIPPQAYVPIPSGITQMKNLILKELKF